ncbi:ethanolamine utilization protein EutH [Listeria ivanovii]|uniref:ethanolamine utilization protein EutH n=1 Tax=Listeria ivanovii TaxID=1638 RepID=UPI0005127E24|nr:ethanolamine utilization protein EutH [Listeria ivanovii]AIS62408.1 ethanolamine utilization protein EutH [Listeria ivanovii subsp. londoniensis]MBK1965198.1 ethanolamine utilization protein EutH [Listeria ivanovii subsp. londoniensis]MBK1984653.1 ethanolamine utilization protein EutH [Listeria ivanovii subsp. londoniensis]MBK1994366.1 ethanolamine utilization protein EutH [Listeria ivanovii subsp. londoniensis]MBM5606967.1 ethanolamine utilization protein EutH [Listeria ivanovii]
MSINEIIIYLMVIFMILGAIDKIIGNKFGLGAQFEEGIMAMGSLTLAMVGIITLAPVLAKILSPIVVPIYTALGADPAMFATTLLANDMGGFALAQELAQTPDAGLFAGAILGSMMGPTIVFTIPVALGIIKKEDHKYLATGVLSGIITIPIGCLIGGLVAGFSPVMIFKNLVPIILVAVLIMIGLWFKPEAMIKGFTVFGKGVVIVATIGLVAGAIQQLTGLTIIPGIAPVSEGIEIVGGIALVLAGAFCLVFVITKVFNKPLMKMGQLLGMNEVAAAGMVATLANSIPMFQMLKDMDERGKIINVAFAVSAAFVLGDHLGFTAGVAKDMIFPMIVGKLVGGVTAVGVAIYMANRMLKKNKAKEQTAVKNNG